MDQQSGKQKVVAVRKNGDGSIVELQLSSGQVVGFEEAQKMAKNDQIENVGVIRGKDGDEHQRSNPDNRTDNNLDQLPTF
jgi:hypothetical protein